ncbi:cytochrome c family protein [Erythrobacter sp. KY5]|uniref:cytochrome c3 family protein n=1 Tax=Erythrobacter sp. KY5 TaxID=2011159 RepID=UPI000DBF2F2D|nr:cytochrome c3 family protein [Erythrobacter sp. KY5]AWW75571.1 cytochrome c family protein [Erythrobacter sp. KY5]
MAFLIRTIDITASGREIVRDREVGKPELITGRAAESDIHLADLAVEQRHVRLADAGGGMLMAESLGGLEFGLNGRSVKDGTIDPNVGAEISVGSARLAISREGDGPVQIIIKQVEKDEAASDALSSFALAAALPSKRTMAWGFTIAILGLLLAVPIVTNLASTPPENDPMDKDVVGATKFDAAWISGGMSVEHAHLEDNCEACHATPFVSVQDETCLSCHEELGLGDHAEMPRLREGMAPLSTGDAIQWSIAETLGKEGPLGCVSCHSEHEGPVDLAAEEHQFWDQQFCSDCHDDLDARLTDVSFGNATDFGDKHPQFRPLIYTAHFSDKPVRVSLDTEPVEMSGLKFTHDEHMDEQGGVARMAISLSQYGAPLECSDCHSEWSDAERDMMRKGGLTDAAVETLGNVKWSQADLKSLKQSGLSKRRVEDLGDYKPVVMEDSCESCHSLVFDRAGPGFRTLRHGNIDDLMADLATMNRGPRGDIVSGRGRPGQFARGGRYYSNFGRPMGLYIAINRALERDGVCGECHIPTMTDGRRDLTPVNLPNRFLMHGAFYHSAHEEDAAGKPLECTECHATSTSNEATDLLIPDLESCRDCHLGETAAKTDEIVPSTCAMCHGYHTPTSPWRPKDHPDMPGNGANDNVAAILSSLRR